MELMESCEKLAADNQGQSNPSLIQSVIRVMDRLGMILRDSHRSQLLITLVSLLAHQHFYLFFLYIPSKKKKKKAASQLVRCMQKPRSKQQTCQAFRVVGDTLI